MASFVLLASVSESSIERYLSFDTTFHSSNLDFVAKQEIYNSIKKSVASVRIVVGSIAHVPPQSGRSPAKLGGTAALAVVFAVLRVV